MGGLAMKVRIAAATATAAAALAAPDAADAATLAAGGTCFVTSAPVAVTGSGFTPSSVVTIGGGAFASVQADAAGNVSAQLRAPLVTAIAPAVVTVTATDTAGVAATASFPVIRAALLSNAPISGRPRQTTTWRFAGFRVPGTAIYGHYRFHGRTIRNHRFGTPAGPCGALTVRARRVPIPASRLRSGTWTLQLDQRRHYRRTGLRRVIRFRIVRTLL
jgi:hypothetical protein